MTANTRGTYRDYLYSLNSDQDRLGVERGGVDASSFKPAASDINKIERKTEATKLTLLAAGEVAPVCFGTDRYFAKPIFPHVYKNVLYVPYLVSWAGDAGISKISKVFIDGVNVNKAEGFLSFPGTAINKYTGAPGQIVDPMLVTALPGFADSYQKFAYLVLKAPVGSTNGFPRVEVEVEGIKIPCYDTHSPFEITTSAVGTRNLLTNSADVKQWTTNGAAVLTSNGMNGTFHKTKVASGGAFLDAAKTSSFTATGRVAVTVYVSKLEGVGSQACVMYDENNGQIAYVGGMIGSERALFTGAGVIDIYDSRDLEDYSVFRFFFTPAVPGHTFTLRVGPGSTVVGAYTTFLGVQIESTDNVDNGVLQYTSNPINIHAFLARRKGETIDVPAAQSAAIWNNDVLPGSMNESRRSLGRVYDKPESMDELLEAVRAYTGCAIVWRNGLMRYVPYRNSLIKTTHITNGSFDTSIASWTDASTNPSAISWDGVDMTLHLDANGAPAVARQRVAVAADVIRNIAVKFLCHGKSTSAPTVTFGSTAGGSEFASGEAVIGEIFQTSVSVPAGHELWIDFTATGTNDSYIDSVDVFSYGPQHYLNADNIRTIKPSRRVSTRSPNKVIIEFTDENNSFQQATAVQMSPEVASNPAAPVRLSRITMAGFNNYNAANREAIERLNSFLISDLLAEVTVHDEGLEYEIGDVCSVTHPIGLAGKPMFITRIEEPMAGDWTIGLAEWDPLLFSNKVEAVPTYTDTNLPLHEKPQPPTDLVLTEELYQRRDGKWDNRIRAEWDPSTSPYVIQYEVHVKQAGVLEHSALEKSPLSVFGPLNENVVYTVDVFALTTLFRSEPLSGTITPLGKSMLPGDVTNFTGYEVGGEVRLSWDEAIDLDIEGYELRYGGPGVSWTSAKLIDKNIPALKYKTKEIPPGTYDFLIKAKDSVKQLSVNAARISNLVVTLDTNAYLVDQGVYPDASVAATLGHIVKEVRGGSDIIYTNTSGQTWSSLFGSATLNSKTDPLAKYQTTPGSPFSWESDEYDLTLNVAGDFRQFSDVSVYAGSAVEEMGLRPAAGSTTWYTALSQKTQARYGKMRVTGNALVRIDLADQRYRVDAVTNKESGQAVTAGASGVTITLANAYSKVKLISITVEGGSAAGFTDGIDAVVLGSPSSFDVYIFDKDDNPVSKSFYWTFEGV